MDIRSKNQSKMWYLSRPPQRKAWPAKTPNCSRTHACVWTCPADLPAKTPTTLSRRSYIQKVMLAVEVEEARVQTLLATFMTLEEDFA